MTTTSKQMAVESDAEKYEKITSVTAHIVKVISVQMSFNDMDALIETFGRPDYELNDIQRAIQREFAQAVYSLR